jgi:RNA polymerase sigma factor (sigma-70 family)
VKVDRSSLQCSSEEFHSLLSWLDSDEQRAGEKYEAIRRRLVQLFALRQCLDPEDLADLTINRVAQRASEMKKSYHGEPSNYFYGVARVILREYSRQGSVRELRKQDLRVSATEKDENGEPGQAYECLGKCLRTLTPDKRELVLAYYKNSKPTKIAAHELAAQLGVTSEALRLRVSRVRTALQECVENCIKSKEQQA